MFILKRNYEYLLNRKDALKEQIKDERKIYENKIEEVMREAQKYKDEVADIRCRFRQIKRLIKAEKQAQNYGSVENSLNRLETAIEKLEKGE